MEGYDVDTALLRRYIDRRHADALVIREALAESRFEIIGNLGHQWKGNALSFGFPQLAEIGKDLEVAAGARDRERVLDLVLQIEAFVKVERLKIKG